MKKLFLFLIVCTLGITGCSDSSKEGDSNTNKITVGLWGDSAQIKVFKELAGQFKEESGIEVTLRQYTDFETDIKTEFIGGTAPDVFYADIFVFDFYVENEMLLPLTDKIDTSVFNSNLVDSFSKNNELYAVPKDYSTLALYYNKKYVNPDDLPKTYKELPAYLKKLQATLPDGMIPMTYNLDLARNMHIAEATGRDIIDENGFATLGQEEIANNLDLLFNLAKEGLIKTPQDLGVKWNGEAFGNEKNAIMIEGNWVAGYLNNSFEDVEYGVINVPTVKDKEVGMLFTVGYGVSSQSKYPEEAIEFIEFMTRKDIAKKWAEETGTLPARTDVAEELKLTEDPTFAPHVKAADYATPWAKGITLNTVNREYKNYMATSINDKKETLETLKKIDEYSNKIIEANKN